MVVNAVQTLTMIVDNLNDFNLNNDLETKHLTIQLSLVKIYLYLNFQQTTMNAGQELMNGSTSITRLNELAERVQAEDLKPLNSSPTPSDKDDKESSIEGLTKRHSAHVLCTTTRFR